MNLQQTNSALGPHGAGGATQPTHFDVATLGEILIDFTCVGTNDQGQTLFAQNPGGAPANVAVAVSRLGGRSAFLGKAGDDMHGTFLRSVLEREGVDASGLVLDPDYFTTLAFVDIKENGERTFSFARKPGADTQFREQEVKLEILDHTTLFHVGSLSVSHQPSRDTTFFALKRAKGHGSMISYDPNYRASLWHSETAAVRQIRGLVPFVDLIKLSEEETWLTTGRSDPEQAAQWLLGRGVKVVAITLGSQGAYLCNREGGAWIHGFSVEAVDTNGAGDSFWAAFLYQVAKSGKRAEQLSLEELKQIARFANAAASLCVQRPGAIPAMPTLEEVRAQLG